MPAKFADVDAYVDSLPPDARTVLTTIRARLRAAVPGSGEVISYQMPTVTVDGRPLVHYAAWKRHIGMYPIPTLDDALEAEIGPYRSTTSTVQFPYVTPFPFDLIDRVVSALAAERMSGARPGGTRSR